MLIYKLPKHGQLTSFILGTYVIFVQKHSHPDGILSVFSKNYLLIARPYYNIRVYFDQARQLKRMVTFSKSNPARGRKRLFRPARVGGKHPEPHKTRGTFERAGPTAVFAHISTDRRPRRRHSPLMLTGVRKGTCSINCRSCGNHILSGCPGSTAAVVCSTTVPLAASSASRQLYV